MLGYPAYFYMKKVFTIMFALILFFSFVSAQESDTLPNLKPGKFNEVYRVKQTCDDASYITISSITYPNSSIAYSNISMEYLGNGEFYFYFNKTDATGRYDVSGIGDGCTGKFDTFFIITKTGSDFDISEAVIYIILTAGIFIVFLIFFYFMLVTPYSNETNVFGEIIAITKYKYVKLGLVLLSYGLFTMFLNSLIGLSNNYLNVPLFFGTVEFFFLVLTKIAYPFSFVIFVIMIFELIRDANIKDSIKKFGKAIR